MGTTGQSVTLANSIIGVGILAMPFCFQQCGLLLATLILVFMGLISRLCCYFLLKSALLARRRNFEFLAFHVFGSAGKMAVEVGIIGFLMGTCIAYFVVVGDLGPQIIAKMLKINQSDILRTSIMVVVSLVCVLPLGLLRNVDSLSNVSAATIGFYFCLVIKVIVEAASQLITGEWQSRVDMWKPAGLLQCVPIISMALFCQTQLFEIFESLPTLSLEKMNLVTKNAINICTGVYFTLGMFGCIAFGAQEISGNVLMSLSPTMASDVIKLGFVMSLAFSFPLIIFPCRASLYSFLYKKVHSPHHDHIINHSIPETTFRCITVAIIAVALFIGLLIPNIELVLGLVGSTIGVLICLVFPAACFVNVTFKNTNERILAKGVIVLGLIIMVLGTYANLQAAENRIDRYDDKFITQERIDKIVEDFFERQENADVYLKPDVKNDPSPIDKHKKVIDYIAPVNDLNKDSEIQPPNPVPPESNEKLPDKKTEHRKEEENILVIPEVKQTPEKVFEMHPKDLRTKFEAKLANGDTLINKNVVVDQFKELKPQSNEPKMEVKQKKLMETIKQHGEEQKVILDEIIKTQKELQQSKKDADPNEAKKIAVESIKKIANIAIKKLGDVSDKPNQLNDDNEVERLEKLKSKAVQEIAKKAFETIEAIQDIKPELAKIDEVKKVEVPKFQENVLNLALAQNISSQQVVQQVLPVNPIGSALKLEPDNNLVSQQNKPNLNLPPNNIIAQQNLPDSNLQKRSDTKPLINQNNANVVEVINENHNNVVIKQPEIARQIVQDTKSDVVKPHSHSPDEPQSYKQGEEVQAKIPIQETKNALNKPIVNDITKQILIKKDDSQDIAVKSNNGIDINKYSNGADHNPNPVPERQKREVVDCTEKVSIKPEDREICDTLSERKQKVMQDTQEYLPSKIDMNNIALPKDLPLEANILHHMSRSLKSYEKDKR